MATNLGELKRKRRQPDARNIKKHSDIMRRTASNLVVGGSRERTETGTVVPGFHGKTFETYFETMLAGTATPSWKHEKKDRTIRVLSGALFILKDDGSGEVQSRALAGDEVAFERGTTYRWSTSKEPVEFFVCQSAKYAATLEIMDDSVFVTKEVPAHLLEDQSLVGRMYKSTGQGQTRRRGSKAKQQLQAMKRKTVAITEEPIPGRQGDVTAQVNPGPSHGKFDKDGAG
jgi:mannose-6-phosphate isomerase-like protein (cupin superfamily)